MNPRSTVDTGDAAGSIASGAGRFAPMDGLRAVAVVLVFATHIAGQKAPGGWIGVTIFFGLSGYLITSLLLREHDRRGAIDLRAFYIRRFLRLAPALVAMVAVVAPIAWWFGMTDVGWTALAALTYTTDVYAPIYGIDQVFTQTWSLAVEEQFYLVWPLVLIVGLRRGWSLLGTAVGLAVASFVTGGVLAATVSPVAAHYTPFPHLPVMLCGAVLAVAVRSGHPGLFRLAAWWIPVIAAAGALAVFLWVKDGTPWLYFGGIITLGVPLVLTVGHLLMVPDGAVARTLRLRPLVWLGERSYGFYLWHFPVAWVVQAVPEYRVLLAVAAPIVSLALTQLSWVCVEQPFLRLKSRFSTV